MKRKKARILLPDGSIIRRVVRMTIRRVGPLYTGYPYRTVIYKGEKYDVAEYHGPLDAEYKLDAKCPG